MSARAIGLLAGLYFVVCVLLAGSACGQSNSQAMPDQNVNPIGKVITVTGSVHVDHPAAVIAQANFPTSGDVPAKVGDFVYRGDVIQTGPNGGLGVTFTDGSSFNVSANAKMEINDFVYDPNGHANSSLMSLSKGTFTFIAGNIAHTGDMKVDTPIGTMGIRGTAPRVEILEDGTVKFSTLIEHK